MKKNIVFFDVETNGLKGSSVLSISALKAFCDYENNVWEKIDDYNRFYFRNDGEEINLQAINVNGLSDDKISELRSGQDYARTFLEDINSFYQFCKDTKHYVAHNIKFDRSFIPFILKNQYDTMIENVNILKIPVEKRNIGEYKYPKLIECAKFYKVPVEETGLHSSMYDVQIMSRVFYVMSKYEKTKESIIKFLSNN